MRPRSAAAFLFLCLSATAQDTRPAPDFELVGLDGSKHALAALRGRIVVLEWTSHRCPSVNAQHEDGNIAAAKAAVAGDDVRWLCIDSSATCARLRDEIRTWAQQRKLAEPYLLDASGDVGRSYGARTTPHAFVVDARGNIAYAGGLGGKDGTTGVGNAVAALRRGQLPWPGVTAPRGCTVKYSEPSAGDDFESAANAMRRGRADAALELLSKSFAAGFATPSEVLTHPDFAPLRRDAPRRARLHALLRKHAREPFAVLADRDEPGEPLRVTGTVRDAHGKAIAGALVVIWHTDCKGLYAEPGVTSDNARLFGFLRTGPEGQYEFRTIRPGSYPDAESAQHVHLGVLADGYRTLDDTLVFDDDPKHHGSPPKDAGKVQRSADGIANVVHDLALAK